ncbi:hypothetical protein VB002_10895 [Campylobacter concisus]
MRALINRKSFLTLCRCWQINFGAENIVPIYTTDAREFNEAVMAHYANFQINFNDSYKITDEKILKLCLRYLRE